MPTPNWTGLQGRVLEGGYELEQSITSDETSASLKVRILGDRFTNAVAIFYTPETITPERMAIWKETRQMQHPNLHTPLEIGVYDLDEQKMPYEILVKPDERLDVSLKERALEPDEAHEILRSAVEALDFLHAHGFVSLRLTPAEVIAIGDSIKLSTNHLRRINMPWQHGEDTTPAGDIYRLGALVFEVLTQQQCGNDCRAETEKLASPFNVIVQRCVDPDPQARCTTADIRAMLRGEQLQQIAKPEPVPLAMAAAAGIGSVQKQTVEPAKAQEPSIPALVAPTPVPKYEGPQKIRIAPERRPPSFARILTYSVIGLIVVLALLWFARPKEPRPQRQAMESATVPVPPQPGPGVSNRPTSLQSHETGAVPAPTHLVASAKGGAARQSVTVNRDIWRVVAFTFARQSDAQKKADLINQKHPDFKAEVFSPNGNSGPYLVVLGGRMNRDDAARLRQDARAAGLPHDSYIQNYNH